LHAEQGFGDTIQFIRFAALIKKQNPLATVAVGCDRPLVKLFECCPSIDHIVGTGDEMPALDVHSPLLSLPSIIKLTVQCIPAELPYAFARPALVRHWTDKLKSHRGVRIGINWRGRLGPGDHLKRNIPIKCFVALAKQFPEISLVSLQKGATQAEFVYFNQQAPMFDPGPDLDTANGAFMDTAAILMNLDLVISSDTSVPHLAGAIGVPVWLVLPYVSDWRWLLDRSDSPWYSTMRLFRQKRAGDWDGVFREIAAGLRELVSAVP
jgi:ADP-heptose:LPS heptosyltransferase